MKKTVSEYRIKPEYIDLWGSDATLDTIVTSDIIESCARGFEMSVEEVMEQLYPNTPSEVAWYTSEKYLKHCNG